MKTVRPRAVFLRVLVETMRFRCNLPRSTLFLPVFASFLLEFTLFRVCFAQNHPTLER